MVNRQSPRTFGLRFAAVLALVSVSLSCTAALARPVHSVISFTTTAPCRVLLSDHSGFVGNIEAFAAAKIGLTHRIVLPLEYISAGRASKAASGIRHSDNSLFLLPCAAALPSAEVVSFACRWIDAALLSAVVTTDNYRLSVTRFANVLLLSLGVPRRSFNSIPTSIANDFHANTTTTQDRPSQGVGSEMIGAMLAGWEEVVGVERDPEYTSIAEVRLAYWTRMRERHGDDVGAIAKAAGRGARPELAADPAQAELF